MKITSGWAKNLPLHTPKGLTTRPTRSRVREAVLSSLQMELPDAQIIDCFAGSGAMGLEMMSRGARKCTFLDSSQEAIACLRANRDALAARAKASQLTPPKIEIRNWDLFQNLAEWIDFFNNCDILWVDPPYDRALEWLTFYLGKKSICIKENGILVIEMRSSDCVEAIRILETQQVFSLKKIKTYGETTVIYADRSSGE